jgi:GT2 family glycosyltransferase
MGELGSAFVTVVVATRSRGDSVIRTARTILTNDYPTFELRVVDQSDDDRTETSLRQYLADARVHYVRVDTKGLSSARNAGIADAQGEIIAITDDDCEVSSNWLRELVAAFVADSRIGIVFGNVVPGPHDSRAGFIPAYIREEPFLARCIDEKHEVDGVGACMGLRRSVWKDLGGFDQMLGAGAPLRANSEGDLVIRALQSGYFVYETPAVQVIHHGFRTWQEGVVLIQRYWYGTGAMYAKYFKIAPHTRGLCATDHLCLPDFLGIGAQKAGTTWLYENLRRHPGVFLAHPKELHYFDETFHRSLRFYAQHFEPGRHQVKGEITPAYSILPMERIRFIRTVMPTVRLIFIIRNPIERAWSQAVMELVTRKKRKLEDVTDSEFEAYLKSEPCTERSDYLTILSNWLRVFPPEQLYIGFFEDIVSHPRKLLGEIFSHIGVSGEVDWGRFPVAQVILPHAAPVAGQSSRTHMRPKIRRFLAQMYEQDIECLYERFGEPVAGWRGV